MPARDTKDHMILPWLAAVGLLLTACNGSGGRSDSQTMEKAAPDDGQPVGSASQSAPASGTAKQLSDQAETAAQQADLTTGEEAERLNEKAERLSKEATVARDTAADGAEKAVTEPGRTLPPATAPFRFIGRWAAAETACGHAAWAFTATGLSTPGATSCRFSRVSPTAGGYDIDARCSTGSRTSSERLKLTFAESAKAMVVEGGPAKAQVGLIYCGHDR